MKKWILCILILSIGVGIYITYFPSIYSADFSKDPKAKEMAGKVRKYLVDEKGYRAEEISYVRGVLSIASDNYIAYAGFKDEPEAMYGYGYNEEGNIGQVCFNFSCKKHVE